MSDTVDNAVNATTGLLALGLTAKVATSVLGKGKLGFGKHSKSKGGKLKW